MEIGTYWSGITGNRESKSLACERSCQDGTEELHVDFVGEQMVQGMDVCRRGRPVSRCRVDSGDVTGIEGSVW